MLFLSSKRFSELEASILLQNDFFRRGLGLSFCSCITPNRLRPKFLFLSFFCIRHASELGGHFTTVYTEMVILYGLVILSGDQCYIPAALLS